MGKTHLQSSIENLHRELASADSIDEETRLLLLDLARDAEKLADDTHGTDIEPARTASQLEETALRFESEHPKLSMALGELIDALSRLGI